MSNIGKFEQVEIYCTDSEITKRADVLQKTDRMLKVAIEGTTITLTLSRKDPNDPSKPYVCNYQGMEFISDGETI